MISIHDNNVATADDGQSLVEVSLILFLVSIVGVALLTSIGDSVVQFLTGVVNAL
jgi:Flp pilus assembly pilin Flp